MLYKLTLTYLNYTNTMLSSDQRIMIEGRVEYKVNKSYE